jgi:uroporphyrinogen decarboxylase
MTSRERVQASLEFRQPDRVPRHLWYLPGVEMFRGEELARMQERYPDDIASAGVSYGPQAVAGGRAYRRGTYRDEWGCLWEVLQDGVVGEVKHPPLADWSALKELKPPRELLSATRSAEETADSPRERFILAGSSVRPFERMQFLRGTENLLMDMAWGDARFHRLRSLLHEFYLEELSLWARSEVDAVSFMDDWGSQNGLLVDPAMWREYFKPLYRQYAGLIHGAGKRVFFHSDGNIEAIIPELVEIGVDALNSQLFCMDLEELGRRFRGKITFWGEIDRQRLLPFGTPEEIRAAVRRVRRALDRGRGGVIAQCEWGNRDPSASIAAVFDSWEEPLAAAVG